MKYIVLMGAPGAGKGTQAKLLEKRLGLPQVATGDLFRHNLNNQTELGKLAQTYMDKGNLVPDEVTVAMVRQRLSQPDCANGAILDGFPRTLAQAEALDALLAEFNGRINAVPFIHVETSVLIERLLKRAEIEGRADDNAETIRNRMNVYQHQTAPLLDFYRNRGLLKEIDGDQSIEAVQETLRQTIESA
ncbi:MAG: adenylate kinase [Ardenticatenaceae bacterium]|nr:adenylate kinase [Anaerolineales bacterium]MCB8922583.1 adenylate kinase [Ardenticatenaceae bacterium]MCB8991251.1 adenylate kinase [Ardenticatenaceae bacterium]MCB9003708.1 adenylate kinase [Ardenticatenaceae bacterium]